jgi:hypothetical protein
MHAKMIRGMSMYNASPTLTDAFLAVFRHAHNTSVGHKNKHGEAYLGHFDPKLMSSLDDLYFTNWGFSAYAHYNNPAHYVDTSEPTGLIPLERSVCEALDIEMWQDEDLEALRERGECTFRSIAPLELTILFYQSFLQCPSAS